MINEYVIKRKTLMEIAKESGCPKTTLSRKLKEFGIPARKAISRYWAESSGRNLVGQKFDLWTVISKTESNRGKSQWHVMCDCGFESIITGTALRLGQSKSCNKCKYKYGNKHRNWKGHGEISSTHWKRIFLNANGRATGNYTSKKKKVEITIEYAWQLFLDQDRKCSLSGLPLKFGSYYADDEITTSLDRIDSNKDYVIGNVQWIHKTINKMKQNLSDQEFIVFCKSVTIHQEKQDGSKIN